MVHSKYKDEELEWFGQNYWRYDRDTFIRMWAARFDDDNFGRKQYTWVKNSYGRDPAFGAPLANPPVPGAKPGDPAWADYDPRRRAQQASSSATAYAPNAAPGPNLPPSTESESRDSPTSRALALPHGFPPPASSVSGLSGQAPSAPYDTNFDEIFGGLDEDQLDASDHGAPTPMPHGRVPYPMMQAAAYRPSASQAPSQGASGYTHAGSNTYAAPTPGSGPSMSLSHGESSVFHGVATYRPPGEAARSPRPVGFPPPGALPYTGQMQYARPMHAGPSMPVSYHPPAHTAQQFSATPSYGWSSAPGMAQQGMGYGSQQPGVSSQYPGISSMAPVQAGEHGNGSQIAASPRYTAGGPPNVRYSMASIPPDSGDRATTSLSYTAAGPPSAPYSMASTTPESLAQISRIDFAQASRPSPTGFPQASQTSSPAHPQAPMLPSAGHGTPYQMPGTSFPQSAEVPAPSAALQGQVPSPSNTGSGSGGKRKRSPSASGSPEAHKRPAHASLTSASPPSAQENSADAGADMFAQRVSHRPAGISNLPPLPSAPAPSFSSPSLHLPTSTFPPLLYHHHQEVLPPLVPFSFSPAPLSFGADTAAAPAEAPPAAALEFTMNSNENNFPVEGGSAINEIAEQNNQSNPAEPTAPGSGAAAPGPAEEELFAGPAAHVDRYGVDVTPLVPGVQERELRRLGLTEDNFLGFGVVGTRGNGLAGDGAAGGFWYSGQHGWCALDGLHRHDAGPGPLGGAAAPGDGNNGEGDEVTVGTGGVYFRSVLDCVLASSAAAAAAAAVAPAFPFALYLRDRPLGSPYLDVDYLVRAARLFGGGGGAEGDTEGEAEQQQQAADLPGGGLGLGPFPIYDDGGEPLVGLPEHEGHPAGDEAVAQLFERVLASVEEAEAEGMGQE